MSKAFIRANARLIRSTYRLNSDGDVVTTRSYFRGQADASGYLFFKLKGRKIYAHMIAYWLANGELPASGRQIDHIDRNRRNNSPDNLRSVSAEENSLNTITNDLIRETIREADQRSRPDHELTPEQLKLRALWQNLRDTHGF